MYVTIKRSKNTNIFQFQQSCHRISLFGNDEATEYAILSHPRIREEVDYNEITKLTQMGGEERYQLDGYRMILKNCQQARKDGREWLWVNTCCIDKYSNVELLDIINSMYWWYESAKVSYTTTSRSVLSHCQ